MCVGINHVQKGNLLYTLIIQVLCVISNDILPNLFFKNILIFAYQELRGPMTKMCIPHTLIDLGQTD